MIRPILGMKSATQMLVFDCNHVKTKYFQQHVHLLLPNPIKQKKSTIKTT